MTDAAFERAGELHVHIDCLSLVGFSASRPQLEKFASALTRQIEQYLSHPESLRRPAGGLAAPRVSLPGGLDGEAVRRVAAALVTQLPAQANPQSNVAPQVRPTSTAKHGGHR